MKTKELFKHSAIASALLLGLSTTAFAIDEDTQTALDTKADKTELQDFGTRISDYLNESLTQIGNNLQQIDNSLTATEDNFNTINTEIGKIQSEKADKSFVDEALDRVAYTTANLYVATQANKNAVETVTAETNQAISDIKDNFNTVETNINNITTGVNDLNAKVDTKADTAYVDEALDRVAYTTANLYAATQANKNAVETVTAETNQALNDIQDNFNTVETNIQNNYDIIKNVAFGVGNLNAKVDKKADKSELDEKANISDVQDALNATSTAINENRAAIQYTEDNVNDLAERVIDNNNIIKNVAFGVGTLNAKVDKKADKSELEKKADKTEINAKLEEKADQSEVDGLTAAYSDVISTLDKKADQSELVTVTTTANKALERTNTNLQTINTNQANITQNTVAIKHLGDRVNKLDKKIKSGLATQSALNGLFQPYSVGKFNLSAAVGGYQSKTALAVGTGYRFNEKVAAKAGIAVGTGKHTGVAYNVGVNFEW